MVDLSQRESKTRPGRRLEKVSHFFLSSQDRQTDADSLHRKEAHPDDEAAFCSSDNASWKAKVQGASSARIFERHLCLVCSSKSPFAHKPFLACNLGIELARRKFSVGLIETTTPPNTFSFLGSFFSELTSKQRGFPLMKGFPPLPTFCPLKLLDIPVDARNTLKAVALEDDLESDDSHTLLNKLKNESDFLIVNVPNDILRFRKLISFVDPFFVVQLTDNPEELLELYLLIKRVSEGIRCKEFGILMMEQDPSRKAEGAFHLIAEMAFNFLSANIRFLGTILMGADFSRSIITQNPLLGGTEDTPAGLSIRRLADGLVRRAQLSERNDQ